MPRKTASRWGGSTSETATRRSARRPPGPLASRGGSGAGVAVVLLWLDYATGLDTQFPSLYFIPVTLAAWYSGRWPALALAIGMPLVHIAFLLTLRTPPEGS